MSAKPDWWSTLRAAVRDPRFEHAERTAFLAVMLRADSESGEVRGGLKKILARSPFKRVNLLSEHLRKAHELGYLETDRRGARRTSARRVVFRTHMIVLPVRSSGSPGSHSSGSAGRPNTSALSSAPSPPTSLVDAAGGEGEGQDHLENDDVGQPVVDLTARPRTTEQRGGRA